MDISTLSPREHEIFMLMGEGLTSTEMSERLFLSIKTVDTYRRHLYEKLGVSNVHKLYVAAAVHVHLNGRLVLGEQLLFLDIDGVLNTKDSYDPKAKSCRINPTCVVWLNMVLDATDCKIVLSSAWRYMVHGRAMSLDGFEYLLRTHGIHCVNRLHGVTDKDDTVHESLVLQAKQRVLQIKAYLAPLRCPFVVVDNMQLDINRFVCTDETVGLTEQKAHDIIRLFGEQHEANSAAKTQGSSLPVATVDHARTVSQRDRDGGVRRNGGSIGARGRQNE